MSHSPRRTSLSDRGCNSDGRCPLSKAGREGIRLAEGASSQGEGQTSCFSRGCLEGARLEDPDPLREGGDSRCKARDAREPAREDDGGERPTDCSKNPGDGWAGGREGFLIPSTRVSSFRRKGET